MKNHLTTLISGILFGFGLGLSQMIDRDCVLGFLDVAGTWTPTLLFVLGGAVGVTIVAFRFVLKRPHPLLADKFYILTKREVDFPLVAGAAVFSIGWGITGYCSGPAITALVLGIWNPVLFFVGMIGVLSLKNG